MVRLKEGKLVSEEKNAIIRPKMFNLRKLWMIGLHFLTIVTLFLLFSAIQVAADSKQRYINRDLDISLVYPKNWIIEPTIEESTLFKVVWRTKKSESLIALCYIRAVENKDWMLYSENFYDHYQELLDGFITATSDRTDQLELVSDKLTRVDGKDVMFTIMKTKIQNLDKVSQMRVYTVLTFWRKHEIAFECATEMLDINPTEFPNAQQKGVIDFQEKIEKTIMQILSTLHFDRTG